MNDRAAQLKAFFIPSIIEAVLYAAMGTGSLVLLKIPVLWRLIILNASVTPSDATLVSSTFASATAFLGVPIVWLFWLLVGSVVYMVVWLVQHVALTVHAGVEEAHSALPTQYLANFGLLIASLIGFVGYVIVGTRIASSLADAFYGGLAAVPRTAKDFLYIAFSVLCMTVILYILVRLWRVVTYAFHVTLLRPQ